MTSPAKNKVLILGGNEIQSRTIKHIQDIGYETIVCDKNPRSPGKNFANKFINEDFKEKQKILNLVLDENISFIFPFNDIAVVTANFISEKLNLPSNGYKNALKQVMKSNMRLECQKKGINQPRFFLVKKVDDIYNNVKKINFPCILKPDFSGGGSRGVVKINNYKQIKESYDIAKKNDLNQNSLVLLEEFIHGDEVAIEGISNDYNDIHIITTSSKTKANTLSRIDIDIKYPYINYESQKDKIYNICENILVALGHRKGLFHIELKINNKGEVFFIESGSRAGGGEILPTILPFFSNIDIVKSQIEIHNKKYTYRSSPRKFACYKFFNIKFGKLKKININKKINSTKSLKVLKILSQPGDIVGYFPDSLHRKDYCVLLNSDELLLENEISLIDKLIKFEVDIPDNLNSFNPWFVNNVK